MRRSIRPLVCLSLLGTAACVPDAVTGPQPAAPAPVAAAQSASDAGAEVQPAPVPKPGQSILLRGPRSLRPDRGSQPLYIVDGVIMCGRDWVNELRASDIESIEVIKGAPAVARFGRATTGVIITTRNPRPAGS